MPNFTLALYEPGHNLLTFPLAVAHRKPVDVPSREPGKDPLDFVITNKDSLLLAENPAGRASALGLIPPGPEITSWLGVPLLVGERALGGIAVALEDPHRQFTQRDQRLLVSIATQSSIAIENAQLYQQARERARQLAHLNSLTIKLSGTLDPQVVLDTVAQVAVRIANSVGAAIFLWADDTHEAMTLARSSDLPDDFTADMQLPLILGRDTPVLLVSNVKQDAHAKPVKDHMLRHGVQAWVELALSDGEELLGILVAYYTEPRKFSVDEVELLRTFANQAAISISNARLYRQTGDALDRRIQQLSALAAINKELSSTLNLDTVFNLVLDRAIEATRSSDGILLLNDTHANTPIVVASRGRGQLDDEVHMDHMPVKEAYDTGKPVVTRDSSRSDGIISQLGVPIVRDMDVLGVILLASPVPDTYSSDDIVFVSQLATQATIAMDNARLFEWMKDNRNRLQVILDSMHDAVIMFDIDGVTSLANPRVEALLGLNPLHIVRRQITDLTRDPDLHFAERLGFDAESLEALFEILRMGAWQGGGRLSYRLEHPRISFIDRTMVSVADTNRNPVGLLMVFSDATEERELTQAREDLSRMIVHDLRSPLTAINTSMKLLGEMMPADDTLARAMRDTTEISQRALRKLLHLVDSLLDIAKIESGNVNLDTEALDLRKMVEGVRAELMPLADELDIRVDISMNGDLPNLVVDGDKIERVFLNLVDNALKFTPLGGLIQVRARLDGNDHVRVEVTDTGPGIPDEYKASIFDRFQQVESSKGNRRGTGLGLTFCKLIIEAHGGAIWIEDNPGGGSVFAFILPVILAPNSESAPV